MDWMEAMDWSAWAANNVRMVLVLMLALGGLYALAGHRLLRLMIGLTGFLLAAFAAGIGAGWLSQGNPWIMGGAALVGGLCGAMALFFVYRAGIFALGGLGMAIVLHGALTGRPESWVPWAIFAGGLLGGFLALWVERPVMILATSAIGAWLATYAGASLLLGEALPERLAAESNGTLAWALLGAWAVIALFGVFFQFFTGRRRRRSRNEVR